MNWERTPNPDSGPGPLVGGPLGAVFHLAASVQRGRVVLPGWVQRVEDDDAPSPSTCQLGSQEHLDV